MKDDWEAGQSWNSGLRKNQHWSKKGTKNMSEQICDICKKEPVRIHIKGQGNYGLKCYNSMVLERSGAIDTFHYPDTMAVREKNGRLHTFHVEHIVLGSTVCWDAYEQNGYFHFRETSDIESDGAAVAQKFFRNSSAIERNTILDC